MGWDNRTICIGNLPRDITEGELDDIFYKYGKIRDIDVKRCRGLAFMEVTITSTSSGPYVSRHTKYRVLINNLPETATWQELKSHASMAGKVCYADIYSEETGKAGVVDYQTEEVMQYALTKLQGTEFKNSMSQSNITVTEYDGRYIGQQHSSEQVVGDDNKSMPKLDGISGPQHIITKQVVEDGDKRLMQEVDRGQKAVAGDKTVMPEIERESRNQHSGQRAVAGDKRRRSDVEGGSLSRPPKIPDKRPRV